MKKTTGILALAFVALLLVALGRAAEDKSGLAALQGTWKGKELGNDDNNACRLIFTGNKIEYRGVDTNDWIKGTFTLQEDKQPRQFAATITDCENADAVGKTALVIYKIEDGVLTVAGNRPGDTNVPSAFDAPGARRFEFKKE